MLSSYFSLCCSNVFPACYITSFFSSPAISFGFHCIFGNIKNFFLHSSFHCLLTRTCRFLLSFSLSSYLSLSFFPFLCPLSFYLTLHLSLWLITYFFWHLRTLKKPSRWASKLFSLSSRNGSNCSHRVFQPVTHFSISSLVFLNPRDLRRAWVRIPAKTPNHTIHTNSEMQVNMSSLR